MHDGLIDVYGSMIRRFQTRMDSGEEVPDCLVKTLIESREAEKLDWEDLCMLSAVFTLGGVHSVSPLFSISVKLLHNSPDIWHHPVVSCSDTSHANIAAKAYEECVSMVVSDVRCPHRGRAQSHIFGQSSKRYP